MFRKNRFRRYGIGVAILLVGGIALFSHYRNSRVQEPVRIYKVTRPTPRVQEAKIALSEPSEPEVTGQADAKQVDTPSIKEPPNPETEMDVADSDVAPEPANPIVEFSEALEAAGDVPNFKTTPAGFPLKPYWDQPEGKQRYFTYEHKLVDHVLVKLWHQGGVISREAPSVTTVGFILTIERRSM